MWKPYKINKEFEITEFYSAFDRICNRGFMFKGESHDFWEIVYVIEGSIVVTADERVIKLSKNQLLFHKPMEFHTQSVHDSDGAHIFILSFYVRGKFIDNFAKKIIYLSPEQLKELMNILEFLRHYNNSTEVAPSPVAYLKNISSDKCFAQKLTNMTENFLINISTAESEETLIVSNETKIYRKAISIIDNNLFDNLTVYEISKMCNVSEAYLKKIFKNYAGIGVHSCVLKSKIAYAKQLLDFGESVSHTAEKLCFSSSNYFSIVFKRETGISPREYKRGNQQKNGRESQHPIRK